MAGISINQIIGSSYIRTANMQSIIADVFAGSNDDKINIFIDLNSCVKKIYSENFDLASIDEDTLLAGLLLNMIIHYRKFFRYYYSVDSNIYLIYSNNCSRTNTVYVPDYNKSSSMIFNSKKTSFIDSNMSILDTICPYLTDVSMITSTFETAAVIEYVINNMLEPGYTDVPNVIITRDIMCDQLVSINPKTIIFRPKKADGNDISYYISNGGCISHFAQTRKFEMLPEHYSINDGLLSFIMAATSVPERNIKSSLSLSKVMSNLSTGISENRIFNGYTPDIYSIIDQFDPMSRSKLLSNRVPQKFKAVDIHSQYLLLEQSPERLSFKPIQNLFSPNGVAEIIYKYFKTIAIDINNL